MSNLENKVIENSTLAKFLGMEELEDLRKMVKETIVEEIREQLHNSYSYIISPDEIGGILQNIVQDACDEIKEEYKEQISEVITKKMDGLFK